MARATKDRDGAHARIYQSWTRLPAWRTLSATGLRLLVHLLASYRPGGNGLADFGAREAAASIGTGKTAAAKALLELQEKGWIASVRIGDFHRKKTAARYALTRYPNDAEGTPETNAFLHWEPIEQSASADGTVRERGHHRPRARTPRNRT